MKVSTLNNSYLFVKATENYEENFENEEEGVIHAKNNDDAIDLGDEFELEDDEAHD